jgi:hypothetical protein
MWIGIQQIKHFFGSGIINTIRDPGLEKIGSRVVPVLEIDGGVVYPLATEGEMRQI